MIQTLRRLLLQKLLDADGRRSVIIRSDPLLATDQPRLLSRPHMEGFLG